MMQTWADYLDQLKREKALANPREESAGSGSAVPLKGKGDLSSGLDKHVPQIRTGFKDTVARPS